MKIAIESNDGVTIKSPLIPTKDTSFIMLKNLILLVRV